MAQPPACLLQPVADVAVLMAELEDWHTAISYCGMNSCAIWATPNTER